jgi:hypothetical protein
MMVTQNLAMIRGDTFRFDVLLSGLDGATVTGMYFTVKAKATEAEAVIQKSLGNGIRQLASEDDEEDAPVRYEVRIAPEDTASATAGTAYVYDLEVHIGEDVYTVLMGQLKLTQDVTRV